MRTNIVINDKLLKEAMSLSGNKTKRGTVEDALKLLVQMKKQVDVRKLFGKLHWEGDLEKSRIDQ